MLKIRKFREVFFERNFHFERKDNGVEGGATKDGVAEMDALKKFRVKRYVNFINFCII